MCGSESSTVVDIDGSDESCVLSGLRGLSSAQNFEMSFSVPGTSAANQYAAEIRVILSWRC
ncbi:unnamed protein product, partial [Brugia timori]|uniref:ZP domain-containing protein n=1 Tax=Brugia timori TaxID=42155 RepID=A0A0R3Q6B5_9BILA